MTVCHPAPKGNHGRMQRRVLASFIAVLVTIGLSGATALPAGTEEVEAADEVGRTHNHVQVINRQDGAQRYRGSIAVAEESDGVVDNSNLALAFASCTDCRTAAAAIQIVVLEARASDVRPANAAVAVNAGCLRCMTFAYAKQVLLSPFQPVTIGREARANLRALGREVDALLAADLPFPELDAALDAVATRVEAVVQAEIDRSIATATAASVADWPASSETWDGEVS